jgi:translocation and assembly module TamB
VAFDYSDGAIALGDACLSDDIARLCIGGERSADGAGQARVQLERLRLAWLTRLAQPDLALTAAGELAGGGTVRFEASGSAHGELQLRSSAGRVSPIGDDETTLLAYRDLQADLTLAGDRHRLQWRAQFDDGGHATADIAMSGAERVLDGQVDVAMNDLALIELASTQFAEVSGQLRGQARVSGTLDAPRAEGAIALEQFATELPRLGLKLREGQLRATADGEGQLKVEGQVTSGDGQLHVTSQGRLDALDALRVAIEGERFLAADIPGARVVITPKLLLERAGERLKLTGEVTIPQASIDLARLPGGGSAKLSPDVVIVDDPPRVDEAATPLSTEVTVVLGDAVKLKGYGLNGEVAGRLVLIDTPRRDTVGRGEIVINGTYKAYGQDLKIERGRLLFAGTAIDDPGLDLRAMRKLAEVTAGLSVKGTARRPELTVFSEPALEQSDAIAYLVTGRPLSALKSGESDMVGTATRALGAATGYLLAKSVGAKLGVDAGVSDEGAIGGAAFTVGKYLSPRLYLSYGVGLFTPGEVITLRYRLSKRWQLEAQSASTSTQAGIDYRIER